MDTTILRSGQDDFLRAAERPGFRAPAEPAAGDWDGLVR
jgi:hypothetical protein